jgi:UDP-N-acetylglucosamine--N-acetylmuramyl-(pentapeptide) pyrophosphoryl-undecaprenol N-acetylglucosamine transferase
MNVVIACGGTGGHLFPGLAVAEALKSRGHEILLLISEKQIDAVAVRDRPEFRVEKIPSIGMPRLFSTRTIPFLGKFVQGLGACRRIYRSFTPGAVLGMGGFTSTGPILAGRMAGAQTFIHESNSIPGKANRLNARIADKVLVGFEECVAHFPQSTVEITGTPIRESLQTPVDRNRALEGFGLRPDLRTILVMGGSQGAHGINQVVTAALPRFVSKPVQFIHLSGQQDEAPVAESYRTAGVPAFVRAFYNRMEEAYAIADLAVARSGAASLTEVSYFGLPSILIPYPHAAENHQLFNAEIFARMGAAEVLQESQGDLLGSLIDQLVNDEARRREMSKRLRALAPENAAARIAELIERSRP